MTEKGGLALVVVRGEEKVAVPVKVRRAETFGARFWGLMLRRELPEGEGLLLAPCNAIHMFFMRFALDVLFLDEMGCVVKVLEGVRPWRVVAPVKAAKATLELAAGSIRRWEFREGDRILEGCLEKGRGSF